MIATIALLPGAIAPPMLSVADVIARHAELTGRIGHVRGVLGSCQPRSCHIRAVRSADTPIVALGSDRSFDGDVARRVADERCVILRATVTDRCWPARPDADHISVCTDRADQLEPIRPIAVLPDEPLPTRKPH